MAAPPLTPSDPLWGLCFHPPWLGFDRVEPWSPKQLSSHRDTASVLFSFEPWLSLGPFGLLFLDTSRQEGGQHLAGETDASHRRVLLAHMGVGHACRAS